jgi:hypothetical protein
MLFGHKRVIRCPEPEESEGHESRPTHVDEDRHEASLAVLE